jgi:hypothetical protein
LGENAALKLSEIQEMIMSDSRVDMSDMAKESVKVIELHAKYLGFYQDEKGVLLLIEREYNKLKLKKVEYYLGRAEDRVYEEKPLHLKIPRQDLDFYLDADDELSDLKRRLTLAQNKVDILKSFIEHNLNQRSHHFRNAIAFLNWSQGK